jgi:hypothetical protein
VCSWAARKNIDLKGTSSNTLYLLHGLLALTTLLWFYFRSEEVHPLLQARVISLSTKATLPWSTLLHRPVGDIQSDLAITRSQAIPLLVQRTMRFDVSLAEARFVAGFSTAIENSPVWAKNKRMSIDRGVDISGFSL